MPNIYRISRIEETTLHIAAAANQKNLVKKLVEGMNRNDLKVENTEGCTPLCYAAITGNVNIAKAILQDQNEDLLSAKKKNEDLLNPGRGLKPLIVAALFGHKEMVKHLSRLTMIDNWPPTEKVELFVAYASIGMYGKHKFLLFATFTYLNHSFSIKLNDCLLLLLSSSSSSSSHLSKRIIPILW